MSSAVAPAIVMSDPAHSPSTARNRIPSNGRSMPDGRAGAGGGTAVASWIVGARGGGGAGRVLRGWGGGGGGWGAAYQRVCDEPAMNVFFWLNHCASITRAIG